VTLSDRSGVWSSGIAELNSDGAVPANSDQMVHLSQRPNLRQWAGPTSGYFADIQAEVETNKGTPDVILNVTNR